MELPSDDICYRSLSTHDARFDGRLFVGVSTGICCVRSAWRASRNARTAASFLAPPLRRVLAFARACTAGRRSRPIPRRGAEPRTRSLARSHSGEGALDGGESSVFLLAERLGMGERHLRRLFDKYLHVPPVAVAQTHRVLFAKQLMQKTRLPMAVIAEASSFGSVRCFNAAFLKLYRRPPGELPVKKNGEPTAIVFRLGYEPPYDWMLSLHF